MGPDDERESVEAVVARLVAEYAGTCLDGSRLRPEQSLRDDLAIDSLALASLALRLGDELGIDWSAHDADLAGLATVGDLISVGRRLSAGGAARST